MLIDRRGSLASRAILVSEFALLFIITMLARVLFIDHEPIHDELYHLLAAQSWANNGSFAIADGEYTRSELYTVLVGIIYQAFGNDVTTVRLSSAVVGSLWVLAVFAWCRYRFNGTVAWFAALLFSLAPGAIFLSQYVRFYVLHGLLFWLAAIGAFELFERNFEPKKCVLLIVAVLLCFAAAAHLQLTTVVGAAGIILYLVFRFLPDQVRKAGSSPSIRRAIAGLLVIVVVGLGIALFSGIAAKVVEIYRWAPAWAGNSGFLKFHWMLVEQYPVFWGTVPVASLLVLYRRSTAGTYCAFIFGTAVILHSFAGMKAERFIFYVMPFFFILVSIFLKEGLDLAGKLVSGIAGGGARDWPRSYAVVRSGVVSIVCLFLLFSNPAFRATADMLRGRPVEMGNTEGRYWSRYDTNWEQAAAMLKALSNNSEVVLSTHELHMLYFVGRIDFELSFSRLSELIDGEWNQGEEFRTDFRTGRPVISSAQSLNQIVDCFNSGLIVVRGRSWLEQATVTDDARAMIESITDRVDISGQWGLRVYQWTDSSVRGGPECESLKALVAAYRLGEN
jgi:hypothetical protein